ncbi:MAG: TolC family protein, partial [Bacteroidales bacterium]
MKQIVFIILTIAILPLQGKTQDRVLDEYIREGLESNQALRQRNIDYTISLSKLKESRSLFFPDIDINARYTVARGGRVIEFPVGDLLNPVYSTLNMLTGTAQFPSIENQSFNFYRPREHETKITMVQPIFNTDLIYNYRIKKEYSGIAHADIGLYERELVKEIKTAYYTCFSALSMLELADSTILLVKENLRVSRRLFDNDKITIDAVHRSEAELSKAEAARARAVNYYESSKSYFNFLINRPLTTDFEPGQVQEPMPVSGLQQAQDHALDKRGELDKISSYISANDYALKLDRSDNLPEITGVVNYGYQGEEYSFTGDDDFVLASLVLQWDLFRGMVNKHKTEQRRLESQKLQEMYREAEESIKMEVLNSYYSVLSAYDQ